MGHQRSRCRGFTLVELALVLAIGGILATTFSSVMYMQVLTYMERLDEVDAHESARAAFNVVRRSVQGARYGLAQNMAARGDVGIGACCTDSGSGAQTNCMAQDGNSDRMRVVNIVPDLNFVGASRYPSTGPCNGNPSPVDATRINVAQSPNYTWPTGQILAVGGSCIDSSEVAGSSAFVLTADAGAANGCTNRYAGTPLAGGAMACLSGWSPGFSFGTGSISDLYVYPDSVNPNVTNLMLRTDPRIARSQAFVVAYNVMQFNISYSIDTTTPPDRRADVSCRDPRSAADGGSCALVDSAGNVLTTQQIANRIVGVQLTLQVRSNTYRPHLPGSLDGFRRWTYSASFALRNNGI